MMPLAFRLLPVTFSTEVDVRLNWTVSVDVDEFTRLRPWKDASPTRLFNCVVSVLNCVAAEVSCEPVCVLAALMIPCNCCRIEMTLCAAWVAVVKDEIA